MVTESNTSRQYIRHPSDIPINWSLGEVAVEGTEYLRNISEGGLAFLSLSEIAPGAIIDINIPIVHPQVTMKGVVIWCHPDVNGHFEIGVRFVDESHRFRMRMVEQICHIEIFKIDIFAKEGRAITGEEAALEWIRRYAKDFPR